MPLFIVVTLLLSLASCGYASKENPGVSTISPNFSKALTFSDVSSNEFETELKKITGLEIGKRLLCQIESLFSKYCDLYKSPPPKINVGMGKSTEFLPSDPTGSPPRTTKTISEGSIQEQEELVDEQREVCVLCQSFLRMNTKLINQIYESLFLLLSVTERQLNAKLLFKVILIS